MKQWIFCLIIALAVPAFAQDKPKPEAQKDAAREPAKEAASPAVDQPKKQASAGSRTKQRRWNEDARHCLERPTNTEIIKCAEEYL